MSETSQIVLGILLLIMVYILTRHIQAWRIKRAYGHVIKDLKRKEAFDPSSAVMLPYARIGLLNLGVRDYRPKALQSLIVNHVVGVTESGNYYLKKKDIELFPSE